LAVTQVNEVPYAPDKSAFPAAFKGYGVVTELHDDLNKAAKALQLSND
jgi:hypothetical protein